MFISPARLKRITLYNLSHLLSPSLLLSEISGSLGDLGTLLPLLLALSLQGSIDLPSTLLFSGLFNILTGVVFGVPLPVQPMKAIAAASLLHGEKGKLGETVAAGVWVALAVLLLGGSGGLKMVMRWVPGGMVKPLGWFSSTPGGDGKGEWLDSRLWAVAAFGGLVVTLGKQQSSSSRRRTAMPVPYALILFLVGLLFAIIRLHLSSPAFPHPHPEIELRTGSWIYNPLAHLHFRAVTHSLLTPESLSTALAQLPLTTLNSIIAASALASDLFPPSGYPQLYYSEESSSSAMPGAWQDHFSHTSDSFPDSDEGPVPLTPLSLSISLMNLLSAPFGCMPLCHGSGGLAAQYRFGARSGTSIILLGSAKLLLGLFFPGAGLLNLLEKFPKAFLGVMVLGAGVELARVGVANTETEEDRMVMLMTAGTILAFRNDGVGFLAGMGTFWGFKVAGLAGRLWERLTREEGGRGWFEEEDGDETDEESALLRR
ncbi:hypothetical protein B0T20DRAFT_450029 [Sordaria brevicollis]|uniref:Molybdate transporter 1 n=1 Tax=Sordaria brevicollis TaxID=83679 RepID=A0AAE0UH64_SORBR|nr:hypothetical protein B0T20DRAFT_450029 [Sordaria brevicollis]